MDDDGMRIDVLEELLDRLAADGRRPKFIYTVPSFQNPAGVTLSAERRRRLVEIARERELLVVEDNPYGLLRYEGEPPEPLYALEGGDYVIYLGTFSKMLSPGIRLGWLCAPPPVMEKVVLGKQASDLCTSTLTPVLRRRVLRRGRVARLHRRPLRGSTLAPRRDAGRARALLPAAGELVAARRAACSCGRRCPSTSTPPTCSRRRCARTSPSSPAPPPTSTAAAAPRCGSTSRARTRTRSARGSAASARVIAEQVELFETITGEFRRAPRLSIRARAEAATCSRSSAASREDRRAQGRPLARAPGLAAKRGQGRGRARLARPRGDPRRRRRPAGAAS